MAGNRESLWQEENLILTGVDNDHFGSQEVYLSCAPIPDFNTTTNTGCQGSEIEFRFMHITLIIYIIIGILVREILHSFLL